MIQPNNFILTFKLRLTIHDHAVRLCKPSVSSRFLASSFIDCCSIVQLLNTLLWNFLDIRPKNDFGVKKELSGFAPARQCSPTGSSIPTAFCYFNDDDFIPQAPLQLYYANPEESWVLEQVRAKGPEVFYMVGVYSLGNDMNLQDMGRALNTGGLVGYLGMASSVPGLDIDDYLALTRVMSLCHAFNLKFGDRIVKASFSFMSDDELMALGFQLKKA